MGLGLSLAAVYYFVVRILPDPGGYLAGFRYWVGVDKAPPVVRHGSGLLFQAQNELLRYADYFGATPQGVEELGELSLVLFGLTLGIWRAIRGSWPDRVLLLGLLVHAALFVVAVSTKSRYYMLLTYPIHALLIARALQQVAAQLRRPALVTVGFAVLVGAAVFGPLKVEERAWDKYVLASRYRAGQEFYELTARLEQLAGPDARILAPPLYWFGFPNHHFTDIFVYERVKRMYGESPSEFLEAVRPDFVITDAKIATDKAVERELYRALDERAPYELIVRHKNHGDVAVYRLSWPK
jgi:hypothetical protein